MQNIQSKRYMTDGPEKILFVGRGNVNTHQIPIILTYSCSLNTNLNTKDAENYYQCQ